MLINSNTLVVMQPTVLPWAGYFNLMYQADDFVFHDDIQLEKRSWQTRNRYLINGKAEWISVPIQHAGEKQLINETLTNIDKKWHDRTRQAFLRSYGKHDHFNDATEIMDYFLGYPTNRLSIRNEQTICFIAERLKIKPRVCRASEIDIDGKRSDKLIKLCHFFQSDIYLSPAGSGDYLIEDNFSERSPAELKLQQYEVRSYKQVGLQEFVSHLSIVDVVANLGWDKARNYVIGSSK